MMPNLGQVSPSPSPGPSPSPSPNPNPNPSPSPNPDQVAPYAAGKRSFYEEPRYVGNKGAQPAASWLSGGVLLAPSSLRLPPAPASLDQQPVDPRWPYQACFPTQEPRRKLLDFVAWACSDAGRQAGCPDCDPL